MSNSLDPDQARHFVGPDLGSNCLLMTLVGKEVTVLRDSKVKSLYKLCGNEDESVDQQENNYFINPQRV